MAAADLFAGGDTPERRQAARIYAAAAEQAAALEPELTFRLSRIDVDSLAVVESVEQLERSYPHDAPALQLIDQAAPLDFNGFGEFSDRVGLQALSTLGSLCALRADLLSARGRTEDAARALTACVRFARALSTFRRAQLSTRLLGSCRILLRHGAVPAAALADLQKSLTTLPDDDTLAADARAQRVRFLEWIQAPAEGPFEALLRRVMRPWIARANRQHLGTFDELVALAAQPWPRKLDVIRQRAERAAREAAPPGAERRGIIARQFLSEGVAYGGFDALSAALDLASRRVLVTALAIERFRADRGAPPAALDALVPAYLPRMPLDPYSGNPIVYAPIPTGYRLYSVDRDQRDDGGAIYGVGSRTARQPPPRQPRDLGVLVELTQAPRIARTPRN
ncbi:MAG TPA: hypothetical protein VFK57_04505 [Vicinamibacterales bacterium]|nr:hypothetical protein [Vicinamibacterales bacterium]